MKNHFPYPMHIFNFYKSKNSNKNFTFFFYVVIIVIGMRKRIQGDEEGMDGKGYQTNSTEETRKKNPFCDAKNTIP